tara:strand:- start:622 stop:753 length:132 start_codon:yes stop_codon:yes gene_type:complete
MAATPASSSWFGFIITFFTGFGLTGVIDFAKDGLSFSLRSLSI